LLALILFPTTKLNSIDNVQTYSIIALMTKHGNFSSINLIRKILVLILYAFI